MSVKNNLGRAHEKRLLHSLPERKIEGGGEEEAAVDRREGWGWRGERGRELRNADPFPRWPLWTAPLPTAALAPSPPGPAPER